MSLWSESGDAQMAQLKRQVASVEAQLAKEANINLSLNQQLQELKQTHKEDVHKLQEESQRAVNAEEQLRKRIEELKLCQTQKANSQQAYIALEAKLKEEQQESKRLNYQLEVVSSQAKGGNNGSSSILQARLAEDKATLERQVQQLTSDLGKVQLELEGEKEIKGKSSAASSSFGFDRQRASAQNDKSIALENEVTALKAEITLLKSKATSRPSLAPTERGNFGFGPSSTTGPRASLLSSATPSRPSSALGNTSISKPSGIPGPGNQAHRRSSSVAVGQSTAPTSARVNQLQAELDDARTKIDVLENDLVLARQKLSAKEREALTLENKVMASTRALSETTQKFQNELEEKVDQIEEQKREVGRVRETLRGEVDRANKAARDEQINSKGLIERLRAEVERKEQEVEMAEVGREEVERALMNKKEEDAKTRKALEEVNARKLELQHEVEALRQQAGTSTSSKEVERQLEQAREEIAELEAGSARTIDESRERTIELERELEATRNELANLPKGMTEEERRKLEAEFEVIHTQLEAELGEVSQRLEAAMAKSLELEAREVVPKEQVDQLQQRLVESEVKVEEAKAEAIRLDSVHSELEDKIAAASSTEAELVEIKDQLAAKEIEIESLKAQLMAQDELHVVALASIADIRDRLEVEKTDLLASVATLTQERDELVLSVEATEKQLEQLETTKIELEQAKDVLASAHLEHEKATRSITSNHQAELDVCDEALQAAEARISELEASIEQLLSTQARSFDDAHVGALEATLADAQKTADDLQVRIVELEALEWGASEAKKLAQTDIARLETEVGELQTLVDELRDAGDQAASEAKTKVNSLRAELDETTDALKEAQEQLADALQRVEEVTSGRDNLIEVREELALEVQGLKFLEAQVVELQSTITSLTRELDSTRATSEDATITHMQDVNDLQKRVHELEVEAEHLRDEATSDESLRAALMTAEARIEELTAELAKGDEQTNELEQQSNDRLNTLTTRAERAENEVHRLRTDLDRATRQLIDAQDQLLSSTGDSERGESSKPSSPGPSPAYSTFSESDASVLVTRLREERDNLRSRLDFARNEQLFRVEALQERIREAEQAKASEVARLEVALLERTVALENESNAGQVKAVEVKAAKARVEELEDELDSAHSELSQARSELERLGNANVNNGEMQERVVRAEHELQVTINASFKLRKTCAALQGKVEELEGRVKRRNQTIALHEQTIASLRTQIEPDDEDETKELEAPPISTSVSAELADRVEELIKTREQLQDDVVVLNGRLEEVHGQLDAAKRAALDASNSRSALEEQITNLDASHELLRHQSNATVAGLREALDSAHTDMSELASRMGTTDQQLAEAKDALASSTTSLSQVQAQLVDELSRGRHLEQHIAHLEHEVEQTHAELTMIDLETAAEREEQEARIEQAEADKARLAAELAEAQEGLAALRQQLEASSQEGERLRALEAKFATTRRALGELQSALQTEQEAASRAQVEARQMIDAERMRSEADAEATKREIQTLRQLGRGADEEVKTLQSHLSRVQLDAQAHLAELDHVRAQLDQAKRESQDQLREVIDNLQLHERTAAAQIEALEARNQDFKRELGNMSASQGITEEARQQIEELEKQIEAKTIEAEELDEKVMEVLRDQKRYVSQIERLKGKIETLTRDLKLARAATTATPSAEVAVTQPPPIQVALAPSSIGKKRRAPAEFDPLPSVTIAPRAVVAPIARTPSKIDKENSASAKKLAPAMLSSAKDGVVPLKPAALSPAPRREALKTVEVNDASSYTPVVLPLSTKSFAPAASTVDSLKARLHGMGARV